MGKLLKDTYYSVLNNLIILFLSFFSGMLVARILGPTGKGEFYLINQIVSVFSVFLSFGIGSSLLFHLKSSTISKKESCSILILYTLAFTFISFIALLLFSNQLLALVNNAITKEQLAYCLLLIVLNIFVSFAGYIVMSASNGIKKWALYNIFGNVSYLFSLILFLLVLDLGLMGAIYSLLISCLFRCILFAKSLGYLCGSLSLVKVNWRKIKLLLKYSSGIFVSNLVLTSVMRINTFFINNYLSSEQLGIYSVAITLAELLLIIPSAIGVAIFPFMASQNNNEKLRTLCQTCRICLLATLLCSVVMILVAYPLIIIIFGEKFISAYIPALFCLPGILAMSLVYSMSNYVSVIGKPFISAFLFSVGLVINIICNIILLKEVGIIGAAVALSLSYIFVSLGFILFICKKCQVSMSDLLYFTKEDWHIIKLKVNTIIH